MKNHRLPQPLVSCFLAAALVLPFFAFAQAPDSETANTGYKLVYRSALSDYEGYKEQSVQSWKEANDKVGEIGGWRAYAKEMRQAAPTTEPAKPVPGHHVDQGDKK